MPRPSGASPASTAWMPRPDGASSPYQVASAARIRRGDARHGRAVPRPLLVGSTSICSAAAARNLGFAQEIRWLECLR